MDKPKQDLENSADLAIEEISARYEAALESDDFTAQGEALLHLGTLYAIRAEYDSAIENYSHALSIQKDISDKSGQSRSLSNMGLAYSDIGDYAKAIQYHSQALSISRDLDDFVAESNHLNNLAETYEFLEDYDKAISYLEQVRELYSSMAVPYLLKKTENTLEALRQAKIEANIAQQDDMPTNTRQPTVIKALHDKRASSETQAIRDKLPNSALQVVEELMKTDDTIQQTVDEAFEAEDTTIIPAVDDLNLGDDGDTEKIKVFDEFNNQDEENMMLKHSAEEDIIRKTIDENEYLLNIAEAIHDLPKTGDYLMRLGALYLKLNQYDEAIEHYEKAMVLFGSLEQTYFREEAERGVMEAQQKKSSKH
jgi:tetratricopeptide (TPR) repeat protein